MNRPLFLTERRPYRQCIRIGDIYAFDYSTGTSTSTH